MDKTFLAVYVIFEECAQRKLEALQDKLLEAGLSGSQTMGIPFHVTLGTFSPKMQSVLIERMTSVVKHTSCFDLTLSSIERFGDSVVFVQPEVNDALRQLQKEFNDNYADGYDWHAHCTIFCPNSQADLAVSILKENFTPFTAKVVSIEVFAVCPDEYILNLPLATE